VAHEMVTLAPGDTGGAFGVQWDRLAAGRGTQADIYSSYAWFSAWLTSLGDRPPEVVVPAVLDREGAPLALLPVVRQRDAWVTAGLKARPRSRVVLAGEHPQPELMSALVDEVGRTGIRELSCRRLPTRDPATALFIGALREAGLVVSVRELSTDNVHEVPGNAALAKRLRKLQSATRSRERRITPHWELGVEHFGGGDRPMAEGLAAFDLIQERSWKGPSKPATQVLRSAFMQRADELGWARLAVLTIAGRPVAANSWFRIGSVAIGLSTAYEQRLAALGPGAILHGHVHRAIFEPDPPTPPPELMDMLPGSSPFKEALAPDRPPLVNVDACRRTLVRGASFAPRVWVRHEGPKVWTRARARVLAAVPSRPAPRRTPHPAPPLVFPPAPGADDGVAVTDVEPGTALRRYLALVAGTASAESVSEAWAPDDRWVLVEDGAVSALARLRPGEPAEIQELVPLSAGVALDRVARQVATSRRAPLQVSGPTRVSWVTTDEDAPPLPWTPTLLDDSAPPRSG
jgi:Acetyltransferase (GNAT) domain